MILFRADASSTIGSGHAMRCLALAEAWQSTGETACFASAHAPADAIVEGGFETLAISAEAGSEADARETGALAQAKGAEWVVVDGYHFSAAYQRTIRDAGCRLLAIDDHGHAGSYAANLVLDQNAHANASSYTQRDADTRFLLGSKFALLRSAFLRWRKWRREFPEPAGKILVTFGGADPANATAKVVEALSEFNGLEIVAVVGPLNHHDLPELPHIRYVRGLADLSVLMSDCDLAIAAAGSTCWELAYLQTPMVLLSIAENQRPVAAALAERGCAIDLGWHAEFAPEEFAAAVMRLLDDPARRLAMAAAGRALIDGEGAARVVTHLMKHLLSLRPAAEDDCRRVWEWSNEAAVREASFHSEPIPWEQHERWFATRLNDPATKFYIAEKPDPLGQTRFAITGDEATISTSIDAAQRGRGLGSAVVLAACERLFAETPVRRIRALIKPHNDASLRAFSRAGFDRTDDTRIDGEAAAQFILEKEAA